MAKAFIMIIVVLGVLAGLILTLRRTANMGTPSKEVLERARHRAQELERKEKADGD